MGWSLQNLSSPSSKVATDGAYKTTSGRLFQMSLDRGMNEYFLCFRRIISFNILCWCPLAWLPGPLGIFGTVCPSVSPVSSSCRHTGTFTKGLINDFVCVI